VSIVMGLDQHRAQITADWLDTDTGEVKRGRVAPADRAGVRRFLERFVGRELEVALEATTGWRFLVEELRRVGAVVRLAEPAETADLRGSKKRAKGDRADARHLRELLMIGRLPESWIPPDHILDLRARVRLRHELGEQRSEWQQRIQATLYHHGCPQRRQLMVGDGRDWLAQQPLPDTAREQVTIALAMTSPSISPIGIARLGTSPGRDRRRCAGRCTRPRRSRGVPARRIVTTTCKPRSGSAVTARACRSHASCSSAATTRCASSERRRSLPHDLPRCAPRPSSHRCTAASSRHAPAATPAWTAQKDRAAATLPPAGSPHHTSCRRPRSQPEGRGPK